jgi:dTDP-4-dehydrorhamnose 3,5-epimerase
MIKKFIFENTKFEGLKLIKPFIAYDNRGSFIKDYSSELFQENGITHELKEVFYTVSHKGVIRALHFQRKKQQAKLVRCITGKIFDVVVDLRNDSSTFMQWEGFELSGENCYQLLIPGGFAHGYLVLEESIVSYKCDEKFFSEFDDGIKWNDPDINISWPLDKVDNKLILAEKDMNLQSFAEFKKIYNGLE